MHRLFVNYAKITEDDFESNCDDSLSQAQKRELLNLLGKNKYSFSSYLKYLGRLKTQLQRKWL